MTEYNVWVSNYNKPQDQLNEYTDKVIKHDYPRVAGKTVRVYVHSRASALDDITEQLEELRTSNRLQPGDLAHLREVFSGGQWKVDPGGVSLLRDND